ncbi:MAG: hypothetical protein DRH37_01465 [Deltaproteobacteria bacterium]|nr:MAG: hypothetical protein DRH37_01465 [Deltaproteobacteria bacterium]
MNYSPDLISSALKMTASLALVLAGMFVVFYFMKRVLNGNRGDSGRKPIRVVANTYVGVKKSISLVEIPGALLVVGITNDHISLLSRIEDKEVLENMRLSEETQIPPSFSDHLHKLSQKIRGQDKEK